MKNNDFPSKKILLIGSMADALINFRTPLIKALQSKGHDVHVALPDAPILSTAHTQLLNLNCTVHSYKLARTGKNPLADAVTLCSLIKLHLKIKPDLTLAYTIKPVIYGLIAAKIASVKNRYSLITGLGYAFQDNKRKSLLQIVAQLLYKLSLRYCTKVFFQNPDDALLFRQLNILKETPTVIVNGSGVDLNHYADATLPATGLAFLMIARLLGDKGVREYAKAAAELKPQHPEVQFQLAGWIDTNPDAITQAELDAWISSGVINYLGKLQDVRPALAACHVFVLPSYREGTPRSVLEAMAVGRAIITTDTPGCKETVEHNINGYLIPHKDTSALATAMLQFIKNPLLAQAMGQESLRIAKDKYDVRKVNAHMLYEMQL